HAGNDIDLAYGGVPRGWQLQLPSDPDRLVGRRTDRYVDRDSLPAQGVRRESGPLRPIHVRPDLATRRSLPWDLQHRPGRPLGLRARVDRRDHHLPADRLGCRLADSDPEPSSFDHDRRRLTADSSFEAAPRWGRLFHLVSPPREAPPPACRFPRRAGCPRSGSMEGIGSPYRPRAARAPRAPASL